MNFLRGNRNTSILTLSFAIGMALMLVIGMVATAVPQFLSSNEQPNNAPAAADREDTDQESDLRQRLDENPNDAAAMVLLADLLANSGRYEDSIRWYERAIEHRPDQISLRIGFAEALRLSGYPFDAEVQLERALEMDEDNVEAMYMLAETLEQDSSSREREARQLYQRIVETQPDSYYAELARERLNEEDGEDNEN